MNDAVIVSLATDITTEHLAAIGAAHSAVDHARRCGELLLEAKARCAHGQWLPWLTTNCPDVSERTAQRYMRLAEHWPELEAKATRVSDLPLRDALALLTDRTTDSPQSPEHDMTGVADLRGELALLARMIEAPDLTVAEAVALVRRADDIEGRALECRIRAMRELGRLLNADGKKAAAEDVMRMSGDEFQLFLRLCDRRIEQLSDRFDDSARADPDNDLPF